MNVRIEIDNGEAKHNNIIMIFFFNRGEWVFMPLSVISWQEIVLVQETSVPYVLLVNVAHNVVANMP